MRFMTSILRRPPAAGRAILRAAVTIGAGLALAACSGKQTWEWDQEAIEAGDAWPPYWTVADCGEVADRTRREQCLESVSRGAPIRPRSPP